MCCRFYRSVVITRVLFIFSVLYPALSEGSGAWNGMDIGQHPRP